MKCVERVRYKAVLRRVGGDTTIKSNQDKEKKLAFTLPEDIEVDIKGISNGRR